MITNEWLNSGNRRGFTLIEMSIVLVLVGIILSLSAGGLGIFFKEAKEKQTKEAVDNAVLAVVSFAGSNKRVPLVQTTPTLIDEFAPLLKNRADSWGNNLSYIFDNNLSSTATGDICGRRTTNLTLRNCLTENCATTAGTDYNDIPNVAFAIWSNGANVSNQMLDNAAAVYGGPFAVTAATTIRVNLNGLPNVPAGSGLNYDDIVSWMTIDELRTKAGCQGSQLKIVNNEIPFANRSSAYKADIHATGGEGAAYKWCISIPSTIPFGNISTSNVLRNNDCWGLNATAWNATGTTRPSISIMNDPNYFPLGKGALPVGSHLITVVARDNKTGLLSCGDSSNTVNCATKSFVLTVNPKSQ